MQTAVRNVLALDVGERRVGVAIGNTLARLASPKTTLNRDDTIWQKLKELVNQEQISVLVIGLPRNLTGEETQQTHLTKDFAQELQKHIDLPMQFQDESLTSKQAEAELIKRRKAYNKADIDALAATIILEDFLTTFHD